MSKQTEDKKLNPLNVNKETVSDLDVPQDQEIVGGAGSTGPAQCIPRSSLGPDDRCGSTDPRLCIKAPPPPSKPYC
jgi:hypothetical protein